MTRWLNLVLAISIISANAFAEVPYTSFEAVKPSAAAAPYSRIYSEFVVVQTTNVSRQNPKAVGQSVTDIMNFLTIISEDKSLSKDERDEWRATFENMLVSMAQNLQDLKISRINNEKIKNFYLAVTMPMIDRLNSNYALTRQFATSSNSHDLSTPEGKKAAMEYMLTRDKILQADYNLLVRLVVGAKTAASNSLFYQFMLKASALTAAGLTVADQLAGNSHSMTYLAAVFLASAAAYSASVVMGKAPTAEVENEADLIKRKYADGNYLNQALMNKCIAELSPN